MKAPDIVKSLVDRFNDRINFKGLCQGAFFTEGDDFFLRELPRICLMSEGTALRDEGTFLSIYEGL
jgi:hypothetical protein